MIFDETSERTLQTETYIHDFNKNAPFFFHILERTLQTETYIHDF
jgi:hypothetical protein